MTPLLSTLHHPSMARFGSESSNPSPPLSRRTILTWILCLAALSVGARNFERGLSVDAPLYAAIARNILRSHDWFRLSAGVPEFNPFAEHPHLGYWLLALTFKLTEVADWSARIPGHLFYVGFLFLFFLYVRRVSGQAAAIWTVVLLWIWHRFANFFSNVYLDPGALFFGALTVFLFDLALEKPHRVLPLAAGASCGLCVMYKGAILVGFLPALVFLLLWHRSCRLLPVLFLFFTGLSLVLGAYLIALSQSSVPDFVDLYFRNQLGKRTGGAIQFSGLLNPQYWEYLLQDTNYLILLLPPALVFGNRKNLLLGLCLLVPFLTIYACEGLARGQYWLTVLPWIAWLLADGVLGKISWDPARLIKPTAALALVGLFVLQYFPVRTHGATVPATHDALYRLAQRSGRAVILIDTFPKESNFADSSLVSWYAGTDVQYPPHLGAIVKADSSRILFTVYSNHEREAFWKQAGWCLEQTLGEAQFWLSCSRD